MSGKRNSTWVLVLAMAWTLVVGLSPREALALCNGCGGAGGIYGRCYLAGEIVYDYINGPNGSPTQYHETLTYYGNCQMNKVIHVGGVLISNDTFFGGCPCGQFDGPYVALSRPFFDIEVPLITGTQVVVHASQNLSALKVVDTATGGTVFAQGPTPTTANISIPRTVLPNGTYLVEGIMASGRIDGSVVLRVTASGVATGLRQALWEDPTTSTTAVRTFVVFQESGTARLAFQHPDNSVEWASATSSVPVPAVPRAALPLVGAGLFACAAFVMLRRRGAPTAA